MTDKSELETVKSMERIRDERDDMGSRKGVVRLGHTNRRNGTGRSLKCERTLYYYFTYLLDHVYPFMLNRAPIDAPSQGKRLS